MKQYDAAVLTKEAYEKGDFSELFPVMAEDYEHMSFWVLEIIKGKDAAIHYYREKGKAVRNSDSVLRGTIVEIVDAPTSVRPNGVYVEGKQIEEDRAFFGRKDWGKAAVLMTQIVRGEEDKILIIPSINEDGMLKQILVTNPNFYVLKEI